MPKKVEFKVVYASGEDDKFRASELDDHGPTVRGWQSAKDCLYPQELIFKLNTPTILTQVQILAHQYLIPERIELWTGPDALADLAEDDILNLPFDYLGYITLGDNRGSGFRSRELKSITIPAGEKTSYVKLSLQCNHSNGHNIYNQVRGWTLKNFLNIHIIIQVNELILLNFLQVGLVAVQLLGEEKNEVTETSLFDDLSFEMYVDKEVARIIRQMEVKKEEAVKSERFRYAGRLKTAMMTLREVGEKLGRLEVGKQHAIANEDYTRANRKKEQMDILRQETYMNLAVTDLLEESGVVAKNDAASSDVTDSNTTLSEEMPATTVVAASCKSPVLEQAEQMHDSLSATNMVLQKSILNTYVEFNDLLSFYSTTKPTPAIVTPVRTGSLRRKGKQQQTPTSSARNSYEAYDERVIPAQRNIHREVKETTTNLHPSCLKMNEREKKQASLPISVFGIALVEKFYSRQFSDKEDGLRDLECILESQETTNKIFRATTFLLHRALRDKVISVYSLAATLVTQLFNKYTSAKITTSELTRSVEKLLPELFLKSGDPTPRVHNTAVHTILSMAHAPELRKLNIIPVHLTRVITTSTHPRLALSRLEMVEQLILSLGISNDKQSGMTCRTLAEFGASGLHHPAEAVRKVSERVLILVYRVNPRLVRKQLPPDDDITRRNLLYRQLMKEFDKIDLEVILILIYYSKVKRERPALKSSVSCYAATNLPEEAVSDSACEGVLDTPSSLPGTNNPLTRNEKAIHLIFVFLTFSRQCIFCLQVCDNFTEEGLNIHYWKFCPMLTRCVHCEEVLEVTGVHRHLLRDCELKSIYRGCEKCNEAISVDMFENHVQDCSGLLKNCNSRCPFCRIPVENSDISWRDHLLTPRRCPKHPRAKYMVHSG
uniref:TOG domain-containing protein n=1 Tax=Rhodnius prolixus TaxID=13249 RepID=T1I0C3_RHOPR